MRPDPGYIFALDPAGGGELLAELPSVYPNGIVVEASRRRRVGGVVHPPRACGGRPTAPSTVVATLAEEHVPDGLKVAANGDLYVTTVTSGGIDIVSPDGSRVDFLAVGSVPTNCAFDGSTAARHGRRRARASRPTRPTAACCGPSSSTTSRGSELFRGSIGA